MFAYALNNPVMFVDPDGYRAAMAIGAAIGALMAGPAKKFKPSQNFVFRPEPGAPRRSFSIAGARCPQRRIQLIRWEALLAHVAQNPAPRPTPPLTPNQRSIVYVGPQSGRPNWVRVDENALKQAFNQQHGGLGVHQFKRDHLGKRAPIQLFDVYIDKNTGMLGIFRKSTRQLVMETDYVITLR